MKHHQLSQIGLLLASIFISACSKHEGDPTPVASTPNPTTTPQVSISFRGLYSIKESDDLAYIVAEFENTGTSGISAFKGKWTVTDDLDETVAEKDVRFTGDTPFATASALVSRHVISPGEKIVIVTQAIRGEDDKVYATTKENVWHVVTVLPNMLQILDNYRVDKKCTFTVEKIVVP
jgi:hypothetical protein